MRKGVRITLLCLAVVLLCSGCSTPGLELKNRLIVQAIGIDALPQGVRLTVQALNTEMAGNPNGSGESGAVTRTLLSEGKTVSEAISALSKQTGKRPLLSQNQAIVFGRETAEKGLFSYLDFFVRDPSSRLTVPVVLSDTTAQELVSAQLGENILSADSITELLQAERYAPTQVSQALYALMNRMQSDVTNAYLPVVRAETQQEEVRLVLCGVSVFSKDRLDFALDEEEIMVLSLLTKNGAGGYWTVEDANRKAQTTVHIRKADVSMQSRLKDETPVFSLRLFVTGDVVETESAAPFSLTKEYLKDTRTLLKEKIEEAVRAALAHCLVSENADPFGLGQRLRQRYPKRFSALFSDWHAVLPEVKYEVEVEAELERIGNGVENL